MPKPITLPTRIKATNPLPEVSIDLSKALDTLERVGGNLDTFLSYQEVSESEAYLFRIQQELLKEENREYAKRWRRALQLSKELRFELLQCRALEMLETFRNVSNSSSATEVAYCKLVLNDLIEGNTALAKHRANRVFGIKSDPEQKTAADELDDLEQQLA